MGVLRLYLAVSVIAWHGGTFPGGLRFLNGTNAVQVFFTVSGFYMGLVLDTKYVGHGSYRRFVVNRFLRIFPAYWVVLALAFVADLAALAVSGAGPLPGYARLSPSSLVFLVLANLFVFGQDATFFLGEGPGGGLAFTPNFWETSPRLPFLLIVPQAWSLSLELMFYLVAPWLARRCVGTLLGVVVLSVALRLFLYYGLGWSSDPWGSRFFPTELALFVLGLLSYRAWNALRRWKPPRGCLAAPALGLLGLAAAFESLPPFPFPGGGQLKLWLFFGTIVAGLPVLFEWTKASAADRALGELSYPLYIVHLLIIFLIEWPARGLWTSLQAMNLAGPVVLALSLAAALALTRLVIVPVDRYRHARSIEREQEPVPVPVPVPEPEPMPALPRVPFELETASARALPPQ